MARSALLAALAALAALLALAGEASALPKGEDEQPPPPPSGDISQHEIDLEGIPPEFLLQQPIDDKLAELDTPFLVQGDPQLSAPFSPRGRRPACSGGPRCSRRPPLPNLEEFPPARPTAGNVGKICADGRRKLSYGPWNLPQTSYSHLARQGEALNSLEEGVRQCCQRPQDEKLPCCSSVWLAVLERFCRAEYATKTRPYHCCRQSGAGRERCFADEAPFPDYDFAAKKPRGCADPSRCEAALAPQGLPALSFPPGEPSGANIRNLCKLRRFRPTYPASSLPKSSFGWFVRRARAVNRMESAFKKCCRTEDVGCAHQAWERVLAQYCQQEFSVKDRRHYCCNKETGQPDYRCFASDAPYPLYDKEIRVLSLAEVTPELLDSLCGQVTLLTKQKNIPALIQNITEPCCPLQGQERTQCAEDAKSEFIATICGPQRSTWKDPKRCCSQMEDAARGSCFDRNYLAQVPVASPAPTVRPTEPAS